MKNRLTRLRNDFMDVVGSISVDELTNNHQVVQSIREIYEELIEEEENNDKR